MTEKKHKPRLPRGYHTWLTGVKNYQKCNRALTTALHELGISLAQHEVLLTIDGNEGLTQQALAEHLLVVKSNVSGLLRRLEQQDFVKRKPDPDDARNKLLTLTPKGRRIVRKSFAIQAGIVDTMMGAMDDGELAQVFASSRKVGEALDTLLSSGRD